jgi:hypothetical protein
MNTYPASLMVRCQELREAGWGLRRIHRILVAEGVNPAPTPTTIHEWINPEYRERQRKSKAEYKRRKRAGAVTPVGGPLKRMVQLREAGLSYTHVANVVNLDYGLSLTGEQARYCIQFDRCPTVVRSRTSNRERVAA